MELRIVMEGRSKPYFKVGHNFLEYFAISSFTRVEMIFPTAILKQIELIYQFLFINMVKLDVLKSDLLGYCLNVLIKLIEEHKIRSWIHLFKILGLIEKSLDALGEISLEEYPLIPLDNVAKIFIEIERRKYSYEDRNRFFDFLKFSKKAILDKRLLVSKHDLEILFKVFEESLIKVNV